MSESRVRENRTHGSIGGRWPEDERRRGKDEKAEAQRLHDPPDYQPAAYLTTFDRDQDTVVGDASVGSWPRGGGGRSSR